MPWGTEERARHAETLATVQGHLEGYADGLEIPHRLNRYTIAAALRGNAEKLKTLSLSLKAEDHHA